MLYEKLHGSFKNRADDPVIDPSGKFAFAFTDYDTVGQFIISSTGTLTANGDIALDANSLAQSMVVGQ